MKERKPEKPMFKSPEMRNVDVEASSRAKVEVDPTGQEVETS